MNGLQLLPPLAHTIMWAEENGLYRLGGGIRRNYNNAAMCMGHEMHLKMQMLQVVRRCYKWFGTDCSARRW